MIKCDSCNAISLEPITNTFTYREYYGSKTLDE